MELKVKKSLNSKTEIEATFDGFDIQDAVRNASCLLEFDGVCGFCQSEEVSMTTRVTKDKGFKYTEFYCLKCGATRPFGSYRDGSGFFLKPWQEKYTSEHHDAG